MSIQVPKNSLVDEVVYTFRRIDAFAFIARLCDELLQVLICTSWFPHVAKAVWHAVGVDGGCLAGVVKRAFGLF